MIDGRMTNLSAADGLEKVPLEGAPCWMGIRFELLGRRRRGGLRGLLGLSLFRFGDDERLLQRDRESASAVTALVHLIKLQSTITSPYLFLFLTL